MKKQFHVVAFLALAFMVGCEAVPTDVAEDTAPLLKNGGGGKPGGGGGGKPSSGTPADPAIAYSASASPKCRSSGGLWVLNADGSNQSDIRCDSPLGRPALLPAWSPDGKSIAFFHQGLRQLVVVDVALDAQGHPIAQNPRPLVSTGDGLSNPAWSPVDDIIAYSIAQTLYTIPAIGGDPTTLCPGCGNAPTWSDDGSELAFASSGALKTVEVGTGVIQTLIPAGKFDRIYDPDWSRAGDRIAFGGRLVDGGSRGTYVFDFTKKGYSLLTDLGFLSAWSPDDQQLVVRNDHQAGNRGGLRVVNSVTGATVRTMVNDGVGGGPDWRRCAPGPDCGPGN